MMNRMTEEASSGFRLPAEWEGESAILLSWPHEGTDWAYMLEEVTECYVGMAEALSRFHTLVVVAPDITVAKRALGHLGDRQILFCQVETNDTWTRDFGPITVVDREGGFEINDFAFNGWGLKFAACHDNMVTSKLCAASVLRAPRVNCLGFVLEGGSIDSDGCGTIMTTSECLLSPNRNGDLSREEVEGELKRRLGADRVLWIDHGYLAGDDTDSHVDTLARFASTDTIVYVAPPEEGDEHYEALSEMEKDLKGFRTKCGLPYNLIGLPLPDAMHDEDGNRLPATYANFLVTERAVFMPTYRQPRKDRLAEQLLQMVFPEHEVVAVDCAALVRQHGSLHCATMQFPRSILPI